MELKRKILYVALLVLTLLACGMEQEIYRRLEYGDDCRREGAYIVCDQER